MERLARGGARTFAGRQRPVICRRGCRPADRGRPVMRIAFVADPLESLDPSVDTSIGLMHAAQDRGAEVWVSEARLLEAVGGRARALARRVRLAPSSPTGDHRWTVPDNWFSATAP